MHIVRLLLFPISLIYGSILFLRNKFFDWGIFSSQKGALPTLLIGNLNTGGTGKTPHTIHLAQSLKNLNPAVLSRGYGRKSKGYYQVEAGMDPEISGDEPQLYLESGINTVAVCENRLLGIEQLKKSGHKGLVILDDALQHRTLNPDYCILMVPGKQPYYKDFYLPSGDLRDHKISASRADAVIISEAPDNLDLVSCRRKLKLKDEQLLFRSKVVYSEPRAWGHQKIFNKTAPIVFLSAIAKAHRPAKHLSNHFDLIKHFKYRDHYRFSQADVLSWIAFLSAHPGSQLVTTAKDAIRLKPFEKELRQLNIFILRINVEIENEAQLINHLKKRFE